jgi:uncharacterized phage protein gp47/JayE
MPWPLPQPDEIADRASGNYEAEYARIWALLNPGAPPATVDARSPVSTLGVHARVLGLVGFDLYLMQARLAQELMPDTAIDWLPRHGAIWGVPQIQPVAAEGNLVLTGTDGLPVPGGMEFTAPGNAIYEVVNSGTIGSSGTISIGVSAAVAGSAGDLAPGVTLTSVSPLAGLLSQSGTIDSNGVTGGADIEETEHWRSRILARIQQRGAGGDANDFEQWTQEVLPGALVYAFSPGVGLISVAIAMPTATGPRVPTSTELSEATAYLNDATNRKPLGAPVIEVFAATLQPVNFTLHLTTDTADIRQGTTNALATYFVGPDINIGSTLDVSRSDAAISAAFGGYAFDRDVPSTDVAPSTVTSLLTLGTVAFV